MARLGKEKVEEDGYTCYCVVKDEPNVRRIFVIFNYRPHRWLVAEGLKPREPSEEDGDGVQLDERRTALECLLDDGLERKVRKLVVHRCAMFV
jgi:hypothetical protein